METLSIDVIKRIPHSHFGLQIKNNDQSSLTEPAKSQNYGQQM